MKYTILKLDTLKAENGDITNAQSCALLAKKMSRGMGLVESNHRAGQITTKQSKPKQNRAEQSRTKQKQWSKEIQVSTKRKQ